jgi:hypothetical protein
LAWTKLLKALAIAVSAGRTKEHAGFPDGPHEARNSAAAIAVEANPFLTFPSPKLNRIVAPDRRIPKKIMDVMRRRHT